MSSIDIGLEFGLLVNFPAAAICRSCQLKHTKCVLYLVPIVALSYHATNKSSLVIEDPSVQAAQGLVWSNSSSGCRAVVCWVSETNKQRAREYWSFNNHKHVSVGAVPPKLHNQLDALLKKIVLLPSYH